MSKHGPLKRGEIRADGEIFWAYHEYGGEWWKSKEDFDLALAKEKVYDSRPEVKERRNARQNAFRTTPEGRKKENARSAEYARRNRASRPEHCLWVGARNRAKRFGLQFGILESDINIPSVCPVLGIPLFQGRGKTSDNSPTLDRLKPEMGYVPGNTFVISHRANKLKNNGTPEEHRAISDWMERNGYGSTH